MTMLATKIQDKPTATRPTAPRKVFCVIEHAYRSELVAQDVCNGRFSLAGTMIEMGNEIDWLTNPLPHDDEAQIEWHKFYYGLDLAQQYRLTGESRFLRTWEHLVRSWIRQVPVDFSSTDVLARRIQNWIYAWQIFAQADLFNRLSNEFELEILDSIEAQVIHLRENLTPERNHRTLELYALFITALAFPHLGRKYRLLEFAMTELHRNLLTDVRPDGVHREISTHYHHTVLRSFLGARHNAELLGLTFPPSFDERLLRMCEFAMHVHRPDGEIPAISDSDSGSYVDLLKLAGEIFSRPDFTYVATTGREGRAPRQLSSSFHDGGYFIQRSGWGNGNEKFENERYLIFDCGPLGDGGHGHYDALSIEVAANGKPLIADTGRFTYSEESAINWRHYFKGTAAHNTVTVDGLDQTTYRRGKPKQPVACATFLQQLNTPDLHVISGKVVSPNYDAIHTRRIIFVRNEYWIIADSMKATESHRYDLRVHLTPDAWNKIITLYSGRNTLVRTPDVALIFDENLKPVVQPSWHSTSYGVKHRSACVSVVEENTDVEFFTVIYPLGGSRATPRFHVEKSDLTFSFEVIGVGDEHRMTDKVVLRLDDERCAIESFQRSEELNNDQ